jgi:hypothetical protein
VDRSYAEEGKESVEKKNHWIEIHREPEGEDDQSERGKEAFCWKQEVQQNMERG